MRNNFIMLSLFLGFAAAFAQQNTAIAVKLKFGFEGLELGKKYISGTNDTLSVNALRFYISSFEIQYKDKTTFKEKNSYHLIDLESPESLNISLKNNSKKEIETISFNVGVDSLASVSGAMDGDLDATKGMYWAWQSGFINMKLEGKSSSCNTRKNAFHFHIGGYLAPNYAMRTVKLQNPDVKSKKLDDINLIVDFAKLFKNINLAEFNNIMIPGKDAMKVADFSVEMFSIE